MKNILVFGATSAIAEATCRIYAKRGATFLLLGRDSSKLDAVAQDLQTRGASKTTTITSDLANTSLHPELFKQINQVIPDIDLLFIAYGTLPNQLDCQKSFIETEKILQTNFISVCSILTYYANYFEQKKSGTIAVITSVAGDRGRQSNYIYGTAKGALSIFLQGLRNRLAPMNVNVIDIKPGFISTPMTAHLKQGLLYASIERAGKGIASAINKGINVKYVPGFWKWIMLVIKLIPEAIFKRMKL